MRPQKMKPLKTHHSLKTIQHPGQVRNLLSGRHPVSSLSGENRAHWAGRHENPEPGQETILISKVTKPKKTKKTKKTKKEREFVIFDQYGDCVLRTGIEEKDLPSEIQDLVQHDGMQEEDLRFAQVCEVDIETTVTVKVK